MEHVRGAPFPGEGLEGNAELAAGLDQDGQAWFHAKAIRRLQRDGRLPDDVMHRPSKYLNNIIEADHSAPKQVIRPARGFQTMKTAHATIKGFDIMRMIRRGHCILRELLPWLATRCGLLPLATRASSCGHAQGSR